MTTEETIMRLLGWLSPAFPSGGFAHSHGLEWAVEAGDVNDAATLRDWIGSLLDHGAPWSDSILLCCAHRAGVAGDPVRLEGLAELAGALAPSRERRIETLSQGRAFAVAAPRAWPLPVLGALASRLGPERIAYPVAVGTAAGESGLPLGATLAGFLHAWTSALVSAALRLLPLGQSAGLACLASLEPDVRRLARAAPDQDLDDLGGAAFRSDLGSMRHETQTTRLFRT